ncbi:hypothetical protein ACTQ49_07475 [Luteococcus sp. Sow4_B9]|uniref:hypothetical protein n=1 Tax=Luteococcus sp. Sow4_B9 TaxID=3438792 RepID=UPI003F9CA67C
MRFVVCGVVGDMDVLECEAPKRATGSLGVAMALAERGASTHFVARLGQDHVAARALELLADAGVGSEWCVRTEGATSEAMLGWRRPEPPRLSEDDWLHVSGPVALGEPGHSAVLGRLSGTEATISCDLTLDHLDGPPEDLWEELDRLLHVVGGAGGLVMTHHVSLGLLGGLDPLAEEDLRELARCWAEAYGIALVVVVWPHYVEAIKADGRVVHVSRTSMDPNRLSEEFVADFLRRYASCPAALEDALSPRREDKALAEPVRGTGEISTGHLL